jgi:hypothetical protein
MPETNVIALDPGRSLAIAYAAALAQTRLGRTEWANGSVEMALILIEARERMSHQVFGEWLTANASNLNAHDRAALMNLGRDPHLMRTLLGATESFSYQLIWNANRVRYANDSITNSPPAQPAATADPNASTGRGPWTAAIDARLMALLTGGATREAAAATLTREFRQTFTKGMVINATRRLGLVERPPSRPAPARHSAEPPAATRAPAQPRGPIRTVQGGASDVILTPAQIDPEFTGTPAEFVRIHGHVRVHTAAQQATMAFTALAAKARTMARHWRDYEAEMRGSSTPISFSDAYWLNWLREPGPRDIAKLAEALEYLRPRIAEAEAALARAQAAGTSQ